MSGGQEGDNEMLESICGYHADLHPYRGEKPGLDIGTTMAHEMIGTVVKVSHLNRHFTHDCSQAHMMEQCLGRLAA